MLTTFLSKRQRTSVNGSIFYMDIKQIYD